MSPSHFQELDVWQVAMVLAKQVYEITAELPREERYGLTSQLQRSAVSIPSNIAEGNARYGARDYARFISMAQGSSAELQTQLLLALELFLGDAAAIEEALSTCDRVGRMLHKLRCSLLQKLESESRVPSPEFRS
ncbi:four helix bundle protein [Xanthomonas translucens]|uniref:four helix bundle protein n=1 Tax=Xanthomonas campestris pv. translucens TaxID=343 RepID=UPI0009BE6694|nr:four helix bundle protein [Xanthomonas translucens]